VTGIVGMEALELNVASPEYSADTSAAPTGKLLVVILAVPVPSSAAAPAPKLVSVRMETSPEGVPAAAGFGTTLMLKVT
jgi:hypothetical protein